MTSCKSHHGGNISNSTLDPENAFQRDREISKGHSTSVLRSSDTSDRSSDIAGGNASLALRDANLNSDTDAGGTGERSGAGREDCQPGQDIGVDRIVRLNAHGVLVPDDDNDDSMTDPLDIDQLSLDPPTSDAL